MASDASRVVEKDSLQGFIRGIVKAVNSGDVIVVASTTTPPQEKEITLSNIQAPKLARKTGTRIDEPYAWASRQFLCKLVLGKLIFFKDDYTLPTVSRSFATVLLGKTSVGAEILRNGLAKLRPPPPSNPTAAAANLDVLIAAEETAKTEAIGVWSKVTPPEAIRTLPPSYFGDAAVDAASFVDEKKGEALTAFVEFVRDGSAMRLLLLGDNNIIMAHLAGVQCPSAGRRATPAFAPPAALPDGVAAADGSAGAVQAPRVSSMSASLSTAQRVAMMQARPQAPVAVPAAPAVAPTMAAIAALSVNADIPPEPYGLEAKRWVDSHLLHREVRFVPENFNGNNIFGSVHFELDGALANLSLELVKLGYARVIEGSARSLPEATRLQLKAAELHAKKTKLGMWENFVPPISNSSAVKNDEFVGQVVEVVSSDCVVVADDAGVGERRINLSSLRAPKIRDRNGLPEPWANEGKEFLRGKLIGKQVAVILEYARSVPLQSGEGDRLMQFGTVVRLATDGPTPSTKSRPASGKNAADSIEGVEPAAMTVTVNGTAHTGVNVAEMILLNGFGEAEKHRDFDERSPHYDNLYNAEKAAERAKRGRYSGRSLQAPRMADLTSGNEAKVRGKAVLSSFQRASGRVQGIVEYVMSGHRLKLVIPSQSCKIFFSLSAVRCPGKGEPFSDDAMAFSRRHALQRDVEVEVEAQDKTGTFLGRCFVGGKNLALLLVEAGLARRLPSYGNRRVPGEEELIAAENRAKSRKLKVWESFVEGQDENGHSASAASGQADMKPTYANISVSEVLVGGEFYYHNEAEKHLVEAMEAQLAGIDFFAPAPPGFAPKKGDVVAVRWGESTWCRAAITSAPRAGASRGDTEYEVNYVDYGNKDSAPLSRIRPLPPPIAGAPHLAHLAKLSNIKVAEEEDGWGLMAGQHLQSLFQDVDGNPTILAARIDGRDFAPGKGSMVLATVSFTGTGASGDAASINALMLQAGYARLDRKSLGKLSATEKETLEAFEEQAKKARSGIWTYGHIDSDDDEADAGRSWGGRNKAKTGAK